MGIESSYAVSADADGSGERLYVNEQTLDIAQEIQAQFKIWPNDTMDHEHLRNLARNGSFMRGLQRVVDDEELHATLRGIKESTAAITPDYQSRLSEANTRLLEILTTALAQDVQQETAFQGDGAYRMPDHSGTDRADEKLTHLAEQLGRSALIFRALRMQDKRYDESTSSQRGWRMGLQMNLTPFLFVGAMALWRVVSGHTDEISTAIQTTLTAIGAFTSMYLPVIRMVARDHRIDQGLELRNRQTDQAIGKLQPELLQLLGSCKSALEPSASVPRIRIAQPVEEEEEQEEDAEDRADRRAAQSPTAPGGALP